MTDDLYAKDLLRWAADTSHAGRLPAPNVSATESNPMCGDRVHLDFQLDADVVSACAHETRACVLTQGSVAILALHSIGEPAETIRALRDSIASMLRSEGACPQGKWSAYQIFMAAAAHKSRHTCVLLPLDAAVKALAAIHPPTEI